jgi:hypothetical protein
MRKLLAPMWDFSQHGGSGLWISELLPHIAKQGNRRCLFNRMQTDSRAHPRLHTGGFEFVRLSLGSWILHGLGSSNQNHLGYATVKPTRTFGGLSNYGNAFLPSAYHATRIDWEGRAVTDPKVRNLTGSVSTPGFADGVLDFTQSMNRQLLQRSGWNLDVKGVIDSLNLSSNMQEAVPHGQGIEGDPRSLRHRRERD